MMEHGTKCNERSSQILALKNYIDTTSRQNKKRTALLHFVVPKMGLEPIHYR